MTSPTEAPLEVKSFQTYSSITPISHCCTLQNFKTNTYIADNGYNHLIIYSTYLYQQLMTLLSEMIGIWWLCNTIFYFPKLQPPRSVPVCGPTSGMHMFAGFVDKICGHFRPAICYGTLPRRSGDLYEMLPIYSSSIWHKALDPPCRVPATIWQNPWQQKHSPACCSNSGPCDDALDTALRSVVEDMKTIL